MLDRYDPSELLALIEGELDASAAATLQQRLDGDPQAAARVRAMMRDRSNLRSIEEPELPADFIAAIEPLLSRPMLIEHVAQPAILTASEFRRVHSRRHRARRFRRFAAAAAVLLLASGGIWAVLTNMDQLRFWGDSGDIMNGRLAINDAITHGAGNNAGLSSRDASTTTADSMMAAGLPLGPGAVHHDLRPYAIASRGDMHLQVNADSSIADRVETRAASMTNVIPADFAIVIQAAGKVAVDEHLKAFVDQGKATTAIVRNFSYAEAQRIADEQRLASGQAPGIAGERPLDRMAGAAAPGVGQLVDASLTRHELSQLASRVREQIRSRAVSGVEGEATANTSVLLAGSLPLAPTLEQQLDFSSRGATHTIAVPASELMALIESLALHDPAAATTSLRMLPSNDAAASAIAVAEAPAIMTWLSEGPRVRQALHRLALTRGDTIVLLPVIVK